MSVTSVNAAPAAPFAATTQHPVYATKADCLQDLELAVAGGPSKVDEVLQRLSRTDVTTWSSDEGSHVD